MASASTGNPAGRPSRITTSVRPCDSPAVRNRSIQGKLYTKFLRASCAATRSRCGFAGVFDGRFLAPRGPVPPMPLIADRFCRLKEDGEIVDLATAEIVRLTIEPPTVNTRERAAACDRLAAPRPPLPLPRAHYGAHGARGLAAHSGLP